MNKKLKAIQALKEKLCTIQSQLERLTRDPKTDQKIITQLY